MFYNNDPYNTRYNYIELAKEFCQYYYTTCDTDYSQLASLYKPDSLIVYAGVEHLGYNNLYNHLLNHYGINKFTHSIQTLDTEPMGTRSLIVMVTGSIKINDYNQSYNQDCKFAETFILQKDDKTNIFYIYNHIFRPL